MRRLDDTLGWQPRAACRGVDPEHFYRNADERTKRDHEVVQGCCGQCPVHQQCFEYALENEALGIWAGTTPTMRRKLRRLLKIKAPGGDDRWTS